MARRLLALLCVLVCLLPARGWAAVCSDGEPTCCCGEDATTVEPPTVRRPSCCELDDPSALAAASTAVIAAQGLDLLAVQAALVLLVDVPAMTDLRLDARPSARAPPSARRRLARLAHWLL